MSISDFFFGKPLAPHEEGGQRVEVWAGIPMLGLDALASAAYVPEAALTVLLSLGALGLSYVLPIIGVIIALLSVVCFSYRQTIAVYPKSGGSYTVARPNLGTSPGLLAAAELFARLRDSSRDRPFCRCRRACFRHPEVTALHTSSISGNSGVDCARQSSGRARGGSGLRHSDIPLHRHSSNSSSHRPDQGALEPW